MDDSGLREKVADIVYDLNDEAGRYQALLPVKKRAAYVDAILSLIDAEYWPLLVQAREALECYREGYAWYLDETGNAKLLAALDAKLGGRP